MPKRTKLVKQATATFRLADLDINEVSVVDKGANLRKLLVVKNAESEEQSKDAVVEAQATKAESTTQLMVSLPAEVRDELGGMLSDVSKRIGILGEAVKASLPGEGSVSDHFKEEVVGIGNMLRRLGGVEKSGKLDAVDVALIKSGEPLGGARLPMSTISKSPIEYVMTPDGPLMKMSPEDMLSVALRYAVSALYSAEDEMLEGNYMKSCMHLYDVMQAIGPFVTASEPEAPQMLMQAHDATLKQFSFNRTPSEQSEVIVAKGNKQFTPDRAAKLEAMQLALAELLGELKSIAPTVEPAAPALTVVKAEPVADVVSPELKGQLKQMVSMIKSLQAENKTLKSSRPLGNASTNEGSGNENTSGKTIWPDDMNDLDDSDLSS